MPGTGLGAGETEISDMNAVLWELGHDLVGEMQPTKICNGLRKALLVEKCATCNIKSGEPVNLRTPFN